MAGLGASPPSLRVAAQPAVVDDVVVGRPRRRRRSPAPPARGLVDVASMAHRRARVRRARARAVPPGRRRRSPSPGVAPDVGGRGAAGSSSCSSASPCCRTATRCRSTCPTSAAARAGRARPGALGGVASGRVRRRRRRAQRSAGASRSACSASPRSWSASFPACSRSATAPGTPREPLADAARRAAPARPPRVGDYRVLYLGDPRLIPFPSDDLGDGVAYRGGRRRPARPPRPLGGRRRPPPTRRAASRRPDRRRRRRGAAAGCSPRSGSASSWCRDRRRRVDASTIPLPVPAGSARGARRQLDLVASLRPADFVRFENRAVIPSTAQLTGAEARRSRLAVTTCSCAPTSPARHAGVRRRRDPSDGATADVAAGVVHLAAPPTTHWLS